MRALRPVLLIRLHPIAASRIGHFASNTELYLCERDAGINRPARRFLDVSFYLGTPANTQLKAMWERQLRIWPEWLLEPVLHLNRLIPGGALHEVGDNTQHDRDVHDLYARVPPHLSFTADEDRRGREGLRALGVPDGADFVCLIGRDSAYLDRLASGHTSFAYHDFRNVDIAKYAQAAEALAKRGVYVIRMGSIVAAPLRSANPGVIDYSASPLQSDFLDVYLSATCLFFVSCATGLDAVAQIFRRPVAFVNMVPAGYWMTFLKDSVCIFKRHRLLSGDRELSLREIFSRQVGFALRADDYRNAGVEVMENTPAEIAAVALEMLERVRGQWEAHPEDETLQRRFMDLYPRESRSAANGRPLHGTMRARYGAAFLRENPAFLD
jgi:putative glycosyltransferase (TIGR04372 family)